MDRQTSQYCLSFAEQAFSIQALDLGAADTFHQPDIEAHVGSRGLPQALLEHCQILQVANLVSSETQITSQPVFIFHNKTVLILISLT